MSNDVLGELDDLLDSDDGIEAEAEKSKPVEPLEERSGNVANNTTP